MKKFLLALGLLCLMLAVFASWFVRPAWYATPADGAKSIEMRVSEGWSATQIAYVLEEKGIIHSALGYRLYTYADAEGRRSKPGTYQLKVGESYQTIVRTLGLGPARTENEISVRIIEGWDLRDMTTELMKDGVDQATFEASAGGHAGKQPMDPRWRERYDFLRELPDDATLEGYLYPDTYRVYKDQLPEGLIKKQLDAFAEHAVRVREEAYKQNRTLHEVVTLASIIEKEVADPSERKIVAGVFWNRLKIGMPLQSDATVNYVTRADRSRPTFKDIEIDSPYNTYKVRGLPPGPVSMPDESALEAALFPDAHGYLYFLTDAKGKLYLAKTLEEHIANRNKAF